MSSTSQLKSAISSKTLLLHCLDKMDIVAVYECLEMRQNDIVRRENGEVGQEQTSRAGSIEKNSHTIWSQKRFYILNTTIGREWFKRKKNLNIRKQKMEDLAKKHKEESSMLKKFQDTFKKQKMEDLVKKNKEESSSFEKTQDTLRKQKMEDLAKNQDTLRKRKLKMKDLAKKQKEELSSLEKNQDTLRKQKMEDLAKKHEEESSWLEKNQRHEITALEETLAREDINEQRYIGCLIELKNEVTQELKKLAVDDECSKLEFIIRIETLSRKMERAVSGERCQMSMEREQEIETLINKLKSIEELGVTNHEAKEVKKDNVEINEVKKCREKTKPNCTRASCQNKGRHRCSRCKAVFYCHENCLSEDWPHHIMFCDYVYEANKAPDDSTGRNPSETANTSDREEVD